jgi:hypothetical protein
MGRQNNRSAGEALSGFCNAERSQAWLLTPSEEPANVTSPLHMFDEPRTEEIRIGVSIRTIPPSTHKSSKCDLALSRGAGRNKDK